MLKDKKYNVLVIAEIPAPYRVDVFAEMSKYMNMDIYFSTSKDQSRSPDYFVKDDVLSFEILNNDKSKKKFKSDLKSISKYDFVIAYHPVCRPALITEIKCRLKKIPYYVNIDGAFINPNIIKDTMKKIIYRGAIGCFAGGKSATEYYLYYGVERDKIFEYGFTSLHDEDIEVRPITPEEKLDIKNALGLPNKKTIISIGQFIYRKGFDVLLEAWSKINREDWQLIIIGGGPEKNSYEKYIINHQLTNVTLIDFLSKDKLKKYYLASDLFVLTTREDVWGLVINEAMAWGLPIVTTEMCNAGTQLIEDGLEGFVVPIDDSISVKNSIENILMAQNLEKMSNNCLRKIKTYTIRNVADSHMKAIRDTFNK